MGRQGVRIDVSSGAQRGQGLDGDLLGRADQPPQVETMALGLLSQLCDEDLGALKPIGFDAQPDVRKARVGVAVLALGKPSCSAR